MASKMLIDASHPEETRVVVMRGKRVEEFDYESTNRKQVRGNIYLAKVVRVEPSLQAAFVEYGGDRHGFLPFSEIHPDYYQIPAADRKALGEEEFEDDNGELTSDSDDSQSTPQSDSARVEVPSQANQSDSADAIDSSLATQSDSIDADDSVQANIPDAASTGDSIKENQTESAIANLTLTTNQSDIVYGDDPQSKNQTTPDNGDDSPSANQSIFVFGEDPLTSNQSESENKTESQPSTQPESSGENHSEANNVSTGDITDLELQDEEIESLGGDALEEVPVRKTVQRKQYKIQDVIKRRQILLLQVLKEERGNKGVSLTTYISLAGRFSVLMPNTNRGGGISRKISSANDRKRLKQIASGLEIPKGMGVIIRTAGASRTKAEIKRDYEFLIRQWEEIRDFTFKSVAPCLIFEEGSLIKRSIRDLYSKEINKIMVSGEEGFTEAKNYMSMLMPSHAKNVQQHMESSPIYAKHAVESQLEAMFNPIVKLKSGGYIVINQTEALVAIDVNSGKSTREHNIEDTALLTNLEASEEVARQLRLRDLAGLIVVDFIDMDERKNNKTVEKKIKECLSTDRAKIQVGRISAFGLFEMSRQRLRTGLLESSTVPCSHCKGTGVERSTESVALLVLREIEDSLLKNSSQNLIVKTGTGVSMYILNNKREHIIELEARFEISIKFEADDTLQSENYVLVTDEKSQKTTKSTRGKSKKSPVVSADIETQPDSESDEEGLKKKKRRRRKKRLPNTENSDATSSVNDSEQSQIEAKNSKEDPGAVVDKSRSSAESRNKNSRRRNNRTKKTSTSMKASAKNKEAVAENDISSSPSQNAENSGASEIGNPLEKPNLNKTASLSSDSQNTDTGTESKTDESTTAASAEKPQKSGWWRRITKD